MMDSTELTQEVTNAGAKLIPPVTVGIASATGWTVQDWMYAATIFYVVLQASHLLWKWWKEYRSAKPDA